MLSFDLNQFTLAQSLSILLFCFLLLGFLLRLLWGSFKGMSHGFMSMMRDSTLLSKRKQQMQGLSWDGFLHQSREDFAQISEQFSCEESRTLRELMERWGIYSGDRHFRHEVYDQRKLGNYGKPLFLIFPSVFFLGEEPRLYLACGFQGHRLELLNRAPVNNALNRNIFEILLD